jgi:hypothetical protein
MDELQAQQTREQVSLLICQKGITCCLMTRDVPTQH